MKRIAWRRVSIIAIVVLVCLAAAYLAFTLRADADPEERIYATVGPETVTFSEIERAYASRDAAQANLTMEEFFEEIHAPRELLVLEAYARNLTVSDEEVDEWVTTINTTLASRNVTFGTYLDDLNLTYDELRSDIRTSTMLTMVLEDAVAKRVNVSAQEVQEAYDAAGYEDLGIPLDQARNEIGPRILREKQDATLRALIEDLSERYPIVVNG